MIVELFKNVAKLPSTAEKVDLLKQYRNLNEDQKSTLDKVFEYAYDPNKMYGVTSDKIVGRTIDVNNQLDIYEYRNILFPKLELLYTRKVTGNAAVDVVCNLLSWLNKDSQQIVLNILDKNLRLGIGYDTYQKEVMGIKPTKFEVTLAQHLEDAKNVNVLDGTWYASRKCDGVRCVAFYNSLDKSVKFFSRQGKEFTTLDNLKPAVANFCKNLIGEWVLDGELCKIDENGDEHFDQIVGECKKKNYTIENCCYQLFDIVTKYEFENPTGLTSFSERYSMLKSMEVFYTKEPKCFIKVLRQELIFFQEDFNRWEQYVQEGSWEGFMLRKDVPFEKGRTKNLLKVKKFHDAEYVVEGVETGTLSTAEPGSGIVSYEGVTALIINHKGNKVHVGSGLTKEQRKEWFASPNNIIGKTICVKYFQESKDKEGNLSLRFPTLKFVYEDGRTV